MMEETGDVGALLDRLQAGDQVALGELFSRYRDRLGRMIQFRLDGRLGGRVAASDVLQEAYIDALKRLPHYQAAPDMPLLIRLRSRDTPSATRSTRGRSAGGFPPSPMIERLKGRLRNPGSAANRHEPRLEQLGEYRIIRELGRGGARHGMLDSRRRQRF